MDALAPTKIPPVDYDEWDDLTPAEEFKTVAMKFLWTNIEIKTVRSKESPVSYFNGESPNDCVEIVVHCDGLNMNDALIELAKRANDYGLNVAGIRNTQTGKSLWYADHLDPRLDSKFSL